MIRLIYKNEIYEMSELANYRLYERACQIIIASGYVSSYELLKYTGIFLTIKANRLYIDHIQDALGRKQKINCPLILISGVIYFGKRKECYPRLECSSFEDVGVICILNSRGGTKVMLGLPKYKYNDLVNFMVNGEIKQGNVYTVDAYGTFLQTEEPSYDIMVRDKKGSCLYKHISESELM